MIFKNSLALVKMSDVLEELSGEFEILEPKKIFWKIDTNHKTVLIEVSAPNVMSSMMYLSLHVGPESTKLCGINANNHDERIFFKHKVQSLMTAFKLKKPLEDLPF